MKYLKYFESMEEFDDELIRDYFNDFELDYDLTIDIKHDEDEFGKFYSIYFELHKLTREMVDELKNSITRVCDQEKLEFDISNIGGKLIEDIKEFYKELFEWTILDNNSNYPDNIEVILKTKD